jgi:hypothetical protein
MIGFGESYLAWLAATVAPAFLGLLVITWTSRFVGVKYLAAFALGIFLLFFNGTLEASANLGVNGGFGGGLPQIALVVLFLVGAVFFVWVDRNRNIFSSQAAIGRYGILIPAIVAIAVGMHGLGEGAAYSGTVFSTSSASLLEAFGGLSSALAYMLHKGLEPMMIGACYCVYARGPRRDVSAWLGDMFLLTIIFVLPSLIAAAVGYYIMFDTTYYFALGAGTSVYAALRLAAPLFGTGETAKPNGPMWVIVSIVLGFLTLYVATLFHSASF